MNIKQTATQFTTGLETMFQKAQQTDEFGFVQLLLGYDGAMGDPRALSHRYESEALFREFLNDVNSDPDNFKSVRIGLFLYSHFFEMSELYRILGNLLHIIRGDGYMIGLFADDGEKQSLDPTDKIAKLKELAVETGFESVIDCFDHLYYNRLRNSFFHSDYSIIGREYILMTNKPMIVDGTRTLTLDLESFIVPLTQATLHIADRFFSLLASSHQSYKSNKMIVGRFPDPQPTVILGHPDRGLIGLENIYGGAIKLVEVGGEPFLAAFNIRVTHPAQLSGRMKRLEELVDKNQYTKNDPILLALEAEIIAANDPKEIKELVIPYYNWGNNIVAIAKKEIVPQKKKSLYKLALEKYNHALTFDPQRPDCIFNRALTFMELGKTGEVIGISDQEISKEFEKVEALKPDQAELYEPWGDLLFQLAKNETDTSKALQLHQQAAQKLSKALQFSNDKNNLLYNTAISHHALVKLFKDDNMRKEAFERAMHFISRAIESDPQNAEYIMTKASILENYADFAEDQSENLINQALDLIEQLTNSHPDIPRAWFKKGIEEINLSRLNAGQQEQLIKQAIKSFSEAIQLNSLNEQYFNNLGLAYLQLGQFYHDDRSFEIIQQAIAHLESALTLKSDHKESYFNLGHCYSLLNELRSDPTIKQKATENFEKARVLGLSFE